MDVLRVFETTVAERELDVSLTCLTLPRATLSGVSEAPDQEDHRGAWLDALGINVIDRGWPSNVSVGLVTLLMGHDADTVRQLTQEAGDVPMRAFFERVDPRLFEFAEYVTHAPIIAFEASPLGFGSLAGIAAATGTVGIGTAVGIAALGMTPLVFVAVPAGIVLVAVSAAFAEGLRYHVLRAMRVPQPSREAKA